MPVRRLFVDFLTPTQLDAICDAAAIVVAALHHWDPDTRDAVPSAGSMSR